MSIYHRICIILIAFYFLPCISHAQQSTLPVFEIKTDTAALLEMDNHYWQALPDKEGLLTIEQIKKSPLIEKFGFVNTVQTVKLNTQWLRFRIRNAMNKTANISLSSESDKSDFYTIDSTGAMVHFVSGANANWNSKAGFKKANAVPLELQPNQELLIYEKRFELNPFIIKPSLRISIYETGKLERSELKDYETRYSPQSGIYRAFLSGLFMLAAIFNFLIYRENKSRVYLYFSLFLLCISMLYQPALLDIAFVKSYYLSNLFGSLELLWVVFFLLFVNRYLGVYKTHPKWNVWLAGNSLLFVVMIFLSALPVDLESNILFSRSRQVFILFYYLLLIITVITGISNRNEARRTFIIAMSPLILFLLLGLLVARFLLNRYHVNSAVFDYALGLSIAWGIVVFSFFLFKGYSQQQKQYVLDQLESERKQHEFMEVQKIELEQQVVARTAELNNSLENLKATQSQLIHAEKMASLGELTAGIAHEIQNPLNFVNNFSDLNMELLKEMNDEIEYGNITEVQELAMVITKNEEKISHHGKRAEGIVKGMLQHSRTSTGQKEPVDLNKLVDEYVRLSYHGYKSKNSDFNAIIKTEFEESLSAGEAGSQTINIIPEDIGRVVLNLMNNAFYAVNEKKKALPLTPEGRTGASKNEKYEPIIRLTTRRLSPSSPDLPAGRGVSVVASVVEITVTDNGNGISQNIKSKIFQPFFTTKPTGEATGLGLSLVYDIVKAHGGDIAVESAEINGTTFIVTLPVG
ncbi:MAG: ATP-binding protein [Ferruginibacter sp.]